FCRLELNLLRRPDCGFVQPMTQTADHVLYLNGSVCQENHIQDHVTLDLQTTPHAGILRHTFFPNVNGDGGAFLASGFFVRRLRGHRLIREAGSLHRAALTAAWRRIRDSVTETRAGYRSANSFVASCAIAVSRPSR